MMVCFLGSTVSAGDRGGYVVTLAPTPPQNSSYTEITGLIDTLLTGYDKRLRPRLWQGNTVNVRAVFVPMSIVEFDMTRQAMTVNGYFVIKWNDEKLRWQKESYSETNVIRIPLKNIWYPQMILREVCIQQTMTNSGLFCLVRFGEPFRFLLHFYNYVILVILRNIVCYIALTYSYV